MTAAIELEHVSYGHRLEPHISDTARWVALYRARRTINVEDINTLKF
jgi:hypothetical protein